ncbi:endonuclease SmrB [Salinivibrio proteolyticus]|uniref:endonuclease SmrB n=1 Tax=Salinivibrio proteolyticus TaxID=334715 RepID=UPI00098978E8|nr:endonuclease SmrB [Salinivibrio proteolyticus]OOF30452.1 endonuclease SmrB [Salinivibrio proteolyticus]
MSKKPSITEEDFALFRDAVKGAKKLEQDTINPPQRQTSKPRKQQQFEQQSRDHAFYFSDEFEPLLSESGPMQYARQGVSKYEVKRLRRGVYVPDIYLDLHGMTQMEAKRELGAMLAACVKDGVQCASVMHGIGKGILKEKIPLWLAQHPDVLAFHQAPLEFGGNGALLVLIDVSDR